VVVVKLSPTTSPSAVPTPSPSCSVAKLRRAIVTIDRLINDYVTNARVAAA
jgi:hypothetical protein